MSIREALLPVPSFDFKVLLVDDQLIVKKIVEKMLEDLPDLQLYYCSKGKEALDMALSIQPTLILQDLVMPDCDGLSLVEQYRQTPSLKNVPVVVLSAQEDPKIKASAFGLGANDYVVKLPDKIEFLARILYHCKSYVRLLERNEAFRKLEVSQSILNQELNEAASYIRSLIPAPMKGEIVSEWALIPSTQLGGDAFGYHWLDEDHLSIYFLDVCGHGVGGALMSISVLNFLKFETLSQTDFLTPSSVLTGLNKVFQMENHNNMFFTIWYGVYNKKNRQLIYSSGGHPPSILIPQGDRSRLIALETSGSAIGIDEDAVFLNHSVLIEPKTILFIYSDGVTELEKKDGTMGGLKDWMEILKNPVWSEKKELDGIIEHAKNVQGKEEFVDDFSLLKIIFNERL